MPDAVRGVLITCDIPIKEFLLWINETRGVTFIIEDLDDTHLFVTEQSMPYIREQLDKLYEENQYTKIT